ncbi:TPA: hypothetical protein ACX96U_002978 [Clostridium sporogenes]
MELIIPIYKYAENFFNNEIGSADTTLEKYARESYKSILELTDDILQINNYNSFSRGSKVILKTMIETAVDLENLSKTKFYTEIMQVMSLKEEVVFIKYYNDYFKTLLYTNNDYNDNKIKNLNEKIQYLLETIDEKYDKITKTHYKFSLLFDRKRHQKYKVFFDILAFYCHNNIHALKKGGIKKIKDISIEEYEDIIASILKNGLINLARIYNREEYIDRKLLKEFKKKIKNEDEQFNFEDIFANYTLYEDYDFE